MMIPRITPIIRYRFKRNSRIIADVFIVLIFLLYWINFNLISDSYGTIPYQINNMK